MIRLLCAFLYIYCTLALSNRSFNPAHLRVLQNDTKGLFKHAWLSYMNYGFPADEVRPLTCEPYGPDFDNPFNIVRNDAMGNISLTLIDNLDTLVIMEEWDEFERALDYLKTQQHTFFDKDTIVQVFETTIRALGGLLSTHLILSDIPKTDQRYTRFAKISAEYDGFLLSMAHDLGKRLIPAFRTKSSIPLPRVHLKNGLQSIPSSLQVDACTSGAGSPVLEFTLLSRLTGDPQFEYFSQVSFWKIWASRLSLDLLPMTLDPHAAKWKDTVSGIGASIDSYYEYAVKSSIIFNDPHMWGVFQSSYKALLTHLVTGGGPSDALMIFTNVDSNEGKLYTDWIDLLSAFWPGLQVLAGQVSDAIKTHLLFLRIWDYFDLIPERWNFRLADSTVSPIALEWYPLRPEFVESTYYLFRATKDPMYLQIGARILDLLKTRYWAKCGLHGVQDIRTGQMQNRMESFVMSETLKYLYLLFDEANESFVHNGMLSLKNWIFSTEAHPLWFTDKLDMLAKREDINATLIRSQDHKKLKETFMKDLQSQGRYKKLQKFVKKLKIEFYRKAGIVVNHDWAFVDLPSFSITDPFQERFHVCKVPPFNAVPQNFPSSRYYSLPDLFDPDWHFKDSFVSPIHLLQNRTEGSYIELDPTFSSIFSLAYPNLQCRRPQSTKSYDVMIGSADEVCDSEIALFKQKSVTTEEQSVVLENDIWLPNLSALRLRVEILEAGKIDSFNNLITQDSIHSLLSHHETLDPTNAGYEAPTALRITKINGVFVSPSLIIWTMPMEGNTGVYDVNEDGRILIEGKVVENMMILFTNE